MSTQDEDAPTELVITYQDPERRYRFGAEMAQIVGATVDVQPRIITRADVVAKAREYIGTPFVHQGRLKGKGIDCVGLGVCPLRELGQVVKDCLNYARRPDGITLSKLLAENLDLVEGEAETGDLMEFGLVGPKWPMHVAWRTDRGMLHTHGDVGRVVEHAYGQPWTGRFVRAWRVRGVSS